MYHSAELDLLMQWDWMCYVPQLIKLLRCLLGALFSVQQFSIKCSIWNQWNMMPHLWLMFVHTFPRLFSHRKGLHIICSMALMTSKWQDVIKLLYLWYNQFCNDYHFNHCSKKSVISKYIFHVLLHLQKMANIFFLLVLQSCLL